MPSAWFSRPLFRISRFEGAANKCLLRIDAKQYLQWIAHGTFEKRTVQSQLLLGYLQFNDFGECFEPGSGHGIEILPRSASN